ncbi:MAG: 30S ribosomal protein S16 [Deltaproteobacteria bacterium]|nr:30S ribosomal protein S16 [Deltaproteobacteria bacterium]
MAARIRLSRHGSKKNPFYRIVAAERRSPRDGRFIEQLGHYDPTREPIELKIHMEKLEGWIRRGATPSATVARLMKKAGWKGLATSAGPAPASAEG